MIFPLCKSLVNPICCPLNQAASAFDASAIAYINAVSPTVTISNPQRAAINAFVVAEKAAGRWSLHKGLWLPIWGSGKAAANAIDMVSVTSGTFAGSVTHSPNTIYFDGTTGYFNTGKSTSVNGLTPSNMGFSFLSTGIASVNAPLMGVCNTASDQAYLTSSAGTVLAAIGNTAWAVYQTYATSIGAIVYTRNSSSSGVWAKCDDVGTTYSTDANSSLGTIPNLNLFVGCQNYIGSPTGFRAGNYGGFGMHLGMSQSQATEFVANFLSLWKTCTGAVIAA